MDKFFNTRFKNFKAITKKYLPNKQATSIKILHLTYYKLCANIIIAIAKRNQVIKVAKKDQEASTISQSFSFAITQDVLLCNKSK